MARHVLGQVVQQVRASHPGLERLVVAALVAASSRSMLLVIAPAGTGKSTAMRAVAETLPDARYYDSVTRAGLQALQRGLSGYRGVVVVDDLGKVESGYNRVSTLTTWAELVYTGYIEKHTYDVHVSLSGFAGSVLVGCQPVALRSVVRSAEWEATIADKTVRYYHMLRPSRPAAEPLRLPDLDVRPLDEVEYDVPDALLVASGLLSYGAAQWSRSRVREHASRLLRGVAAVRGGIRVTDGDAAWARWAFAPLALERALFHKAGFEGGRELESDVLCLLTELASYGRVTDDDWYRDYRVRGPVARAILSRMTGWWQADGDAVVASETARRWLAACHPEVRNGRGSGTTGARRAPVDGAGPHAGVQRPEAGRSASESR